MDLLVVEDESRVAGFLKGSLEAEGHTVRVCHTLENARVFLDTPDQGMDAVVLDRMLEGGDGLTLIPQFKKRFPDCRILILSAIDLPDEKAKALDLGADDYLAKPFSLSELSARLRALARRTQAKPSHITRCKDICADMLQQAVTVSGKRLELSKKEYQVLLLFIQNPGRVFNKFQLLDKVWDQQFTIESNTVEVTIRHLRCKLEDAQSAVEISSKRNVGYWIEA